ncbi:hypothetical protein SOMG_03695 [Schizosaccharomyces osmophilus]|uniref:Uncharacterized protein n=1 Tax=Schizosaccharomyces osmophilus TaxID=2545709 RepID=A0AAE9WE57_9SCHI|nr:uncharacterized protein SOMG_03695 [Schizosaccharomyces osmophilus]WBW73581.1 hypothetical protein SOMG_03695 [Schizosaccharomyces osmophilus]
MSSFAGKSTDLASKAKKYMSSPGSVHNADQNFSNDEQTRAGGNFDSRYGNEERGYSNADHSAAPEYSHPSQGDPYSGQTADTGRGYSSQRGNTGSGQKYGSDQKYDSSDLGGGNGNYRKPSQTEGYTQNTEYGSSQGTEDYGESYGRRGGGGSYGSSGATGGAYTTAGDYGAGDDSYGSTGGSKGGNYSTAGDYGGGRGTSTYNASDQDTYNTGSNVNKGNQYDSGQYDKYSTGRNQPTTGASQGNYNTTGGDEGYLGSGREGYQSNSGSLGEEGQYGSKAGQTASGSKDEGYNAGKYTTDPTATSSRAGGSDQAGQNLSQSGGQKLDQAGNAAQRGKSGTQGVKSEAQDLGNDAQHHASLASRMKGGMEKMFGKMTHDDDLVQKGETMKSGGGNRL